MDIITSNKSDVIDYLMGAELLWPPSCDTFLIYTFIDLIIFNKEINFSEFKVYILINDGQNRILLGIEYPIFEYF